MFFITGITTKRKALDYYNPIMCKTCGKYGRYEAFVEYMVLSLFFIPIFKWNKKYYAYTTCCNSLYLINNKEKALAIERGQGQNVSLNEEDLVLLQTGNAYLKFRCPNCGFEMEDDCNYCPKCGSKLK
jgi:predicted Zn-ribbon and HTH transcriptional regulator